MRAAAQGPRGLAVAMKALHPVGEFCRSTTALGRAIRLPPGEREPGKSDGRHSRAPLSRPSAERSDPARFAVMANQSRTAVTPGAVVHRALEPPRALSEGNPRDVRAA